MPKTKVYQAMKKVIERLRNDDGTFDAEVLFVIGVLGEHVDISQEEFLMLANKEVTLTFENHGDNKVLTIKALRNVWAAPEGGIHGLKILKEVVEGLSIVVPLDVANDIKEKCGAEGAFVYIA